MGTRALIGREVATENGLHDWRAIYHHWDGYPTVLGKTLWNALHGSGPFAGRLEDFLNFLIEQHPAGWSTINGADLTKRPGYREIGIRHRGEPRLEDFHSPYTAYWEAKAAWEAAQGPQCYCHGDRHEKLDAHADRYGDDWGAEWAYIFLPEHEALRIYVRNGGRWQYVVDVSIMLEAAEPDWEAIEARENDIRFGSDDEEEDDED